MTTTKCKNCGHELRTRLVRDDNSREYSHLIKESRILPTISRKCKCGCLNPEPEVKQWNN